MLTTKRKPASVGEILIEEFMEPMGLTQGALAKAMGVQRKHVNELCNERRAVTAPTALILARVFGNSPAFWLNVQRRSDLWEAMHSPRERKRIKRSTPQPRRKRRYNVSGASHLGNVSSRGGMVDDARHSRAFRRLPEPVEMLARVTAHLICREASALGLGGIECVTQRVQLGLLNGMARGVLSLRVHHGSVVPRFV